MRGKELHVGIGLCGIRITPAYAGKSFLVNLAAQPRGDHPPRMRGKELHESGREERARITPACAGKRD